MHVKRSNCSVRAADAGCHRRQCGVGEGVIMRVVVYTLLAAALTFAATIGLLLWVEFR